MIYPIVSREGEKSHIGFVRDNQLIKFETIYAEIQTAMRTIHTVIFILFL